MTSLPDKPHVSTPPPVAAEYISLADAQDNATSESPRSNRDDSPSSQGPITNPPLPTEEAPPLPADAPLESTADDGWEPVWDETAQAFYFYNRLSQKTQWENPRIQDSASLTATMADRGPPGVDPGSVPKKAKPGGYDPAIHGDYDPNADYAKAYELHPHHDPPAAATTAETTEAYGATGAFNRFTGKWQRSELDPSNFNDENKSHRQMNAFFDVDAAANSHNGRSLKAERSNKKLSKAELKSFREKRKAKKEEKRRAWLRD